MKVLIIEDESRAANHLKRLINSIDGSIEIVETIESVVDALRYLREKPTIDLILSDIQLVDGLSFDIYKQVQVSCPIIFTTAYDQYAIEAFNTNGIDYLLKPIEEKRLKKAFDKVQQFMPNQSMLQIQKMLQSSVDKSFKSRFMVKAGDRIKTIAIEDVAAFYSQDKGTYLLNNNERSYAIDYALDELAGLVNPQLFFKVNRKFIVSINSCTNMLAFTNSRLKITISGHHEPVIVARETIDLNMY